MNKNTNQFPHIKRKLKTSEIKPLREQMLINQDYVCPLCQQIIDPETTNGPVLDHCHFTGVIRAVIHRFCNTYLSRIENGTKRNKITDEQLKVILKNAYDYIKIDTPYLHPTYKSPIDKLLSRNKKKRKK